MTAYKNYGWKPPTAAQREAQRVFKETDSKAAMSEYERVQAAFHANRERLKAERLARDPRAAPPQFRGVALFRRAPEPSNQAAFIVPSQSVRW